MVETVSSMLPLGTVAPDFKLLDVCTDKTLSLQELKSDTATVIMFICNHCPYVKHIQKKLVEVVNAYQKKGIAFIAISSNDIKTYPADSPINMRKEAETQGYKFPYLFDETQSVAKDYRAECTPDFYVFDSVLACVYRGRFDDATPGNGHAVTGKDLTRALDAVLAGDQVAEEQMPSMGCNIKWV